MNMDHLMTTHSLCWVGTSRQSVDVAADNVLLLKLPRYGSHGCLISAMFQLAPLEAVDRHESL